MPSGGARPNSGPPKGTKYRPRVGKNGDGLLRKKRVKFLKILLKLLKNKNKKLIHSNHKIHISTCSYCGKEFIYEIKTSGLKYCSDECRKAQSRKYQKKWDEKICEYCGRVYKTQNGRVSKYCSLTCKGKVSSENNKAKRPTYYCKKCGKPFFRNSRKTDSFIYCSRKCAGLSEMGKGQTPNNYKRGNYRKRAKIYGVPFENINIMDIFERDEWHCKICGVITPKEKRGTTRHDAPELDHIVPMSTGGGHLYNNVQCACRKCNGLKSNKSEVGQFPLFNN